MLVSPIAIDTLYNTRTARSGTLSPDNVIVALQGILTIGRMLTNTGGSAFSGGRGSMAPCLSRHVAARFMLLAGRDGVSPRLAAPP